MYCFSTTHSILFKVYFIQIYACIDVYNSSTLSVSVFMLRFRTQNKIAAISVLLRLLTANCEFSEVKYIPYNQDTQKKVNCNTPCIGSRSVRGWSYQLQVWAAVLWSHQGWESSCELFRQEQDYETTEGVPTNLRLQTTGEGGTVCTCMYSWVIIIVMFFNNC